MIHIEYFTFNAFQERCSVVWDEEGNSAIIDPGFYSPAERDILFRFIESHRLTVRAILLTHGHFDHIYGVAEAAGYYNAPVYMHPADKVIIDEANPALCPAFGLKTPEAFGGTNHSVSMNPCGTSHQAPVNDGTDAVSECSISLNSCGTSHQAPVNDGTDAVSECSISLNSCGTNHSVRPVKEGDTISIGSLNFEVIETPGHTPGGVCYLERTEKILFSGDTLFAGSIGRTDNQWADYDSLMSGIFGKLMELDGDITVIPGHGPDTSIATERMTNPFLMPFNEPFEG